MKHTEPKNPTLNLMASRIKTTMSRMASKALTTAPTAQADTERRTGEVNQYRQQSKKMGINTWIYKTGKQGNKISIDTVTTKGT